jgi:GNAT superfamily N-acetyltransferase
MSGQASIVVRRIRAGDAMQYRELRLRALKTDPHAFGGSYENALDRTHESWIEAATRNSSSNDCALFVAERSDGLIGLAGTMREERGPEVFGVYQVWVAPEVRRGGIGTRLMAALEGFARANGAVVLELTVEDAATDARRLYERVGFAPDGERMKKRLT